jgi:hypothetical protein
VGEELGVRAKKQVPHTHCELKESALVSSTLLVREGAQPCAPIPLSHLVGEGLGVRAT